MQIKKKKSIDFNLISPVLILMGMLIMTMMIMVMMMIVKAILKVIVMTTATRIINNKNDTKTDIGNDNQYY